MTAQTQSDRTRVKRGARRAVYDRETILSILDCGMLCHIAFVFDGYPVVLPTFYWREGDRLYWHGSSKSGMLRAIDGAEICISVTHLDGLVLARSAFHHSANYRSVTLFGKATVVHDADARAAHLKAWVESLYPGRWGSLRPMSDAEFKATRIMSMPIDEVSAKVRAGPPCDMEDYDWPVWAGVIPLSLNAGPPTCDGEGASPGCRPPPVAGVARQNPSR